MTAHSAPTDLLRAWLNPLPAATHSDHHPEVAYFCAEYGLAEGLPFYAGGLGILAGDVVKAAADEDFPMVGVGLFYHGKRDRQVVDPDGWQHYVPYEFDPEGQGFTEVTLPDGSPWRTTLHLDGDEVHVFALARHLSEHVTVYFLETDRPINSPHIRELTSAPYWGDERMQLQQQFVLGAGGIRLLRDLELMPEVFHLNEGRPAVLVWELAEWLQETHGLDGCAAIQAARERIVYTNHTLVRAGNLSYPWDLVERFVEPWANALGMPTTALLECGIDDHEDRFGITEFGLAMSRIASGVSERHTELCRDQWPEFSWVNITNGVHFPTWQRQELVMDDLTDSEVWQAHQGAKRELVDEAARRTGIVYDPERLVLGWARRITGYKRLDSLFVDVERLRQIVSRADRPVQLVVAGKAHPGDEQAKEHLQEIIRLFQNELSGHALFIPNYDIELARYLVSGVDIWLNTPVDGREACGTSGMKAAANGVLQASVADGWVAEVDLTDIGWTLDPENPGEHIMSLVENEWDELFWNRDADGVPREWVRRMRASQQLAKSFSATRMLREYQEKLYEN